MSEVTAGVTAGVTAERLHRHPLAALRARLGLSATEYLRLLAARHRELGFGAMATRREKVARWESGATTPDDTAQLAMADLHGVEAEAVRRSGWPHWLLRAFPADAVVLEAPWTAAGALAALSATVRGLEDDHRGFAIVDPLVSRGEFGALCRHCELADPDPVLSARSHDPPMTTALAAVLHDRLGDLTRLRERIPPAHLRDLALGDLSRLERLSTRTRFDVTTGRRMLTLIAGTAEICGTACATGGRVAAAQTAYLAAARAATAAGDLLRARRMLARVGRLALETPTVPGAGHLAGRAVARPA